MDRGHERGDDAGRCVVRRDRARQRGQRLQHQHVARRGHGSRARGGNGECVLVACRKSAPLHNQQRARCARVGEDFLADGRPVEQPRDAAARVCVLHVGKQRKVLVGRRDRADNFDGCSRREHHVQVLRYRDVAVRERDDVGPGLDSPRQEDLI